MFLSKQDARALHELANAQLKQADRQLRNCSEDEKPERVKILQKWVRITEHLEGIIAQQSLF
jgi:hypothetical protein